MRNHARPVRRGLAAATAAGLVSLSLIGAAGPAHAAAHPAAPVNTYPLTYDAVGTSTIAKTGSVVAIGPTTLSTVLNTDTGAFTGHLPIPSTSTSFKALGLLPVSATVGFKEAAPVTGQLTLGEQVTVTSTASYYITLSNVKIAGLPAFAGSKCQTKAPVSIPVDTPPGEGIDLTQGGHLVGTYTLGQFANCGLSTVLINQLVPGPGNTVSITLSNGR